MVRISVNDEEPQMEMLEDDEYDDFLCGFMSSEEMRLRSLKMAQNELNGERVVDHLNAHYSGMRRRRSVMHMLDDQEKFELFANPKMAVRKNQAALNLKYFAKYNSDLGLRISVDGLHNMEPDWLYMVVFALVPPNTFWRPFAVSEHVHFTWHWDWSSTAGSPKFINHHLLRFGHFNHHRNAVLVADVRRMRVRLNEDDELTVTLQQFGWSFFPLFADRKELDRYGDNHHDVYAQNGIFQNILFEGAPDEVVLNEILEIGPRAYIKNQCALTKKQRSTKRLRPCKGNASVFVSIYDEERVWTVDEPFDREKLDTSLIPQQLLADYRYTTLEDEHEQKSSIFSMFSISYSLRQQTLWSRLPADIHMNDVGDLEEQIADRIAAQLHQQRQPRSLGT